MAVFFKQRDAVNQVCQQICGEMIGRSEHWTTCSTSQPEVVVQTKVGDSGMGVPRDWRAKGPISIVCVIGFGSNVVLEGFLRVSCLKPKPEVVL